jgi:tRNA/tmRNA/rRNA uracil-C5-methylase (TrmA/RlmC/RlmD family)
VEVVVSPGSGERAAIIAPSAGPRGAARRAQAAESAGRRAAALLGGRVDTVLVARQGARQGKLTTVTGRGSLRQRAGGRSWLVGAGAFWQIHPGAAGALTEAVIDALSPRPGEVALDLYCGAGLFTAALAAAVGPGGAVTGIDADRAAVRDARRNLRRMPWARVHAGDVAGLLASQAGARRAGLAVLDPPRAGAGRAVIERLLAAQGPSLRAVAYVSCDPATLARDIAVFGEYGWRLSRLRAFDAFPMTHHVECVATLTPG